MKRLVRLRADPTKVRVSIRYSPMYWDWIVTIASRCSDSTVMTQHGNAERAVEEALALADAAGIDGIDLECQWAYEHPWGGNEST